MFHNTQGEVIWPKEFLKLMHSDKSAKMAMWQFFCQIAILALLSLCIDFKNSFSQMTSCWVLWKTYYTLLLKKCLGSYQGLSMYLSKRINWNISSFSREISKILFDLGNWNIFGRLGSRIREVPFHVYLKFQARGVTTWLKKSNTAWKSLIQFDQFWTTWTNLIIFEPV